MTFDHFATIKAHLTGFFVRFDALAIDQGPAWGRGAASLLPIHFAQGRVDRFQGAAA